MESISFNVNLGYYTIFKSLKILEEVENMI
jgi:hypothetical protein